MQGCEALEFLLLKSAKSESLFVSFIFWILNLFNHSRWAPISTTSMWRSITWVHLIILIFQLLLDVAEVLSSLIDHERRPIRIEFLTLQGKPNTHAWGAKSPTQYFPFLSGLWIRATPSTIEYGYSAPTCWPHENDVQCSKRVRVKSTPRSNQELCLPITIFLGMWLVRSNA